MRTRTPAVRQEPLLLRVSTVATLLDMSVKAVRGMIARNELPALRVGGRVMVPRLAFESWLQQLPGTSADEAIRNLAQRALVAGLRPERVETT